MSENASMLASAPAPPVEWACDESVRARFGMLLFLATETMFFAGLISALVILRAGQPGWPPVGQPRLPVEMTGLNTLLLLISAYTMQRAFAGLRAGRQTALVRWLWITGALGAVFLAVQGAEWVRLVRFGLTFTSSLYGGTFYTLIGAHALHVLGAMAALSVVTLKASMGRYGPGRTVGVDLCRMYWFFVVAVWPVLYGLVYLR